MSFSNEISFIISPHINTELYTLKVTSYSYTTPVTPFHCADVMILLEMTSVDVVVA